MKKLDNIVQLNENILSFENDGYELTEEMKEKYQKSKIKISNQQLISNDKRFCKNASIFDVTGLKIAWGDIAPEYVNEMFGIYYVLSEYKSLWDFRKMLPNMEPIAIDINYIKKNAIARIVEGKIETNDNLMFLHFQ